MTDVAGWLVLGTKISDDNFDKQLSNLKKRAEKKQVDIEVQTDKIREAKKNVQDIENELREYEKKIEEVSAKAERFAELESRYPNITDDERMEYAGLAIQNIEKQEQEALETLQQKSAEYEKATSELEKQESILAKQNQDYEGIVKNIQELQNQRIKQQVEEVRGSVQGIVKTVAKWGLAVLSVSSAYMLMKRSITVLSQYNEKIASDIKAIQLSLASALEPIIRWIIDLVLKLIGYLGYIIKAWTGRNIFENTNKGLKKAESGAKKLQKTLAGFDEMNVLQDSSASGGGGASTGATKLDIPDKVPGWVEFIAKNGKEILAVITGLVAGLTALKLGAEGITALGIGVLVTGLVLLIQDIIAVINDPSWQNFINILGDIAIAIGGIMLITGNWWGLLVAIAGAIVKLVADNWDAIVGVLSTVGNWIYDNVISPVANFFAVMWTKIKLDVERTWNAIVSVVSGVAEWVNNNIIQPVGSVITDMWNGFVDGAKFAWEGIKSVFSTVANFFKTIFTTAWTAVKNVFSTGGKIFDGIKDGIVSAFKTIVNAIINGINKVVAIPFNAINSVLRKLKSISILGISPFGWVKEFSVPQIPTLAKGGIINQPGRGVAIGGEAGQEGVIPLTDTQQMQRLGEAIGKYITVNAQMNNYMNGRLISRELQQIQNDENFAFNGG